MVYPDFKKQNIGDTFSANVPCLVKNWVHQYNRNQQYECAALMKMCFGLVHQLILQVQSSLMNITVNVPQLAQTANSNLL